MELDDLVSLPNIMEICKKKSHSITSTPSDTSEGSSQNDSDSDYSTNEDTMNGDFWNTFFKKKKIDHIDIGSCKPNKKQYDMYDDGTVRELIERNGISRNKNYQQILTLRINLLNKLYKNGYGINKNLTNLLAKDFFLFLVEFADFNDNSYSLFQTNNGNYYSPKSFSIKSALKSLTFTSKLIFPKNIDYLSLLNKFQELAERCNEQIKNNKEILHQMLFLIYHSNMNDRTKLMDTFIRNLMLVNQNNPDVSCVE